MKPFHLDEATISDVHAAGFQVNYLAPPKNFNLFFKFYQEYRALARSEGRTIIFGGSYTFRFPKPPPPPAPKS